jgi:predicted  nucleic acid-binding Zn-ribbon protein
VAADAQYEEVRRLAGPTPAALEASLLVLLQQRRFDDAAKRADEILAKSPTDLTAQRAKIWIATVGKNYTAAMLAADKLGQQLADDPPRAADEQAIHDELHSFLGRIFGFLGGPVAESVIQDDRKTSERRIVDRISETRRAKFDQARDGVVAKFLELTGNKDEERQRVIDQAAAAREKTLKELESEKETIAGRVKELDGRKDKLQTELRDELAEIAKDDQPLVQELARLDARARALNRDLFAYESQISQLQALLAGEMDPDRRFGLQVEIDRLSLATSRLESDLLSVRRLADGVGSQRAALRARQLRAQAAAAEQANRIDKETSNLAKRDRVNDAIEKRVNKPASGTTSKTRALAAQATALSTYDQFPLEAARQKLLESLR